MSELMYGECPRCGAALTADHQCLSISERDTNKIETDGWNYDDPDGEGDSRKIVTLDQGGMTWVGIRHWNSKWRHWMNNGEPCATEKVIAWRDLPPTARGFWNNGLLHIPREPLA